MGNDGGDPLFGHLWLTAALIIWNVLVTSGDPQVDRIYPNTGSFMGKTKVTFTGSGFKKGSPLGPDTGTVMKFVGQETFDCALVETTMTDNSLTCTTAAMPQMWYTIAVEMNGKDIPQKNLHSSSKRFYSDPNRAPAIWSVSPTAVAPKSIVRTNGRIFTDVYGSDKTAATNGNLAVILRCYTTGKDCKLKDENGTLYGLALDSETSNNGHFYAKLDGTYVGNQNVSFIVDRLYGNSYGHPISFHISGNKDIYMFQTFAEIVSFTPSIGSLEGGTEITVKVKNLQNVDTATLEVAGLNCPITYRNETEETLMCKVPKLPPDACTAGGRGLLQEHWWKIPSGYRTPDDILNYNATFDNYTMSYTQSAYWEDSNIDNYVSRLKGYFVPPFDGEYSLMINTDDQSSFFMSPDCNPANKVKVASVRYWSSNYYRFPEQIANRTKLEANKQYYIELVHREHTGRSHMKIGAKFFHNSYFTNPMLDKARPEKQDVCFYSTTTREKQILKLGDFTPNKATVYEIQSLVVTGATGKFRLKLMGVYTVALGTDANAAKILTALRELPSYDKNYFDFEVQCKSQGYCDITFKTDIGDIPMLGKWKSSGVSVTITEKTKGQSSGQMVQLKHGDDYAPGFLLSASETKAKEALEVLFSSRCHKSLRNSGQYGTYHIDYDTVKPTVTKYQVKQDVDAFCGRGSARNPYNIYYVTGGQAGLSLSKYHKICLAYKDEKMDISTTDSSKTVRLYVYYSYTESGTKKTYRAIFYLPKTDKQTWGYTCIDATSITRTAVTSDPKAEIYRLIISRSAQIQNLYIDEVNIASANTVELNSDNKLEDGNKDINDLRRPRVKAVESITLAKSMDSDNKTVYTIELKPQNCDNSFSKLTIPSGQRPQGSTFSNDQTPANRPIEGKFNLTCNGRTIYDISVDLTANEFKSYVETFPKVGKVSVSRSGNCDNFCFKISFLNYPGDMPTCKIDHGQVTGKDINVQINEEDGHLLFDPIPSEFLRTFRTVPQVSGTVNRIPNKCSIDGGCGFMQKEANTPTITGIENSVARKKRATLLEGQQYTHSIPTGQYVGTSSSTIKISGTKFDGTTMSNNVVTIGGKWKCTVTAATTTSITCSIPAGIPGGNHKVMVTVKPHGYAAHPVNETIEFKCTTEVTSSNSTSFGLGGGDLFLVGKCFNKPEVKIDGKPCKVILSTISLVQCMVPPVTSGSIGNAVSLTQKTSSGPEAITTTIKVDYLESMTPNISSIEPKKSSVEGGMTLTINGTGFTQSTTVEIGWKPCPLMKTMDTMLECTLPSMPPGKYPVLVNVPGKGPAVQMSDNTVPDIDYDFKVTQVHPEKGSILGGTTLTIKGEGLNSANVTVNVGKHTCVVDHSSLTDSQLICTIPKTAKIHKVNNGGPNEHKVRRWIPSVVSIVVGDKVEWSWSSDKHVTSLNVKVEETEGPTGVVPKSGGFSSPGVPSKNGIYTHQFTKIGTYYYWSGEFRGTVIVDDFKSNIQPVIVQIGKIEAIQDRDAGASALTDSSSCPGTNNKITGVTDDPLPTSPNATNLYFTFAKAWTPVVNGVSPNNGTSLTTVQLSGIGFPDNSKKCRAEVKFGESNVCTAKSSSSSTVDCMLDSNIEASHIGVLLALQFRLKNLGYGLNIGTRHFAIMPSVTSVSPCEGSVKGGTTLTIEGYSFPVGMVTVTIGGVSCINLVRISHKKITCVTQSSVEGNRAIQVKAGNNLVATFENGVCSEFAYNSTLTPTCTSVSPDTKINGTLKMYTIAMDVFNDNPMSSDVTVTVNGIKGQNITAKNGEITFKLQYAVIGQHSISILVDNKGYALCTQKLTSEPTIDGSMITPTEGSRHGGTRLTLHGNGFTCATTVKINNRNCVVDCSSVTLGYLVCVTPYNGVGAQTLTIGPQSYPSQTFTYTDAKTPEITSVSPVSGTSGDVITIGGSKFSATDSENTVTVNGKNCPVVSGSSKVDEIRCTVGNDKAGTYDVQVHVTSKGLSNTANFTYNLEITSIAKNTGSCQGMQKVTVSGSGIDYTFGNVTICGKECTKLPINSSSSSTFECMTPPADTCVSKTECDVVMTSGTVVKTLAKAFTYDPDLTPIITCIEPKRGGTGGGTKVTISGTKFGTDKDKTKVTIAGVNCAVESVTTTKIVCITEQRKGTAKEHVVVEYDSNGEAKQPTDDDCKFHYIDVWSSRFTWGNKEPPTDGDLVVIPPNQDILLDTTTAKLSLLLIQGNLVFDEKDITLNAHYILVAGGKLEVGTKEKPFQHQAKIVMHGHLMTKELPVYGAKVLAVRQGTLDLHGQPVTHTWTRLASTANKDDTTITLKLEVDWKVGDKVVIASTGDKLSQKENEVRYITAISNNKTLTLDKKLEYKHLGVTETVNGKLLEFRAEVGLLSRNIKFQGSVDRQWNDTIPACPNGFNPGEFATQTCFQGRFGEEIGNDQFGGHIMIAPENRDVDEAVGRISYVELEYVGQAFRLGRYPIHFHLNGRVSKSYVEGCGIDRSFNRAVNIHATHYLNVTKNVIHNIMGGAFFLEDGIETNNVFDENLAVFVIASSSLLNDDITPAAFWVTHPNNIIINNAGAGGTHFCFWYRMHENPSGPSATTSICPQKEKMGVFRNNQCHSQGWFGIWIFPIYTPVKDGSCSSSEPAPAEFTDFFVWNCEKGAEVVVAGDIHFTDMVLVNNELASIEGKLIRSAEGVTPTYSNILSVGRSSVLPEPKHKCTLTGIVLPYGLGQNVKNTHFVNYDNNCAALAMTRVQGTCSVLCGAFIYYVDNLSFDNVLNRIRFVWEFEGVFIDKDGSLAGTAGSSVIPTTGTLPDTCSSITQFKTGIPASVCPSDITFIRFSFNNPSPISLEYKDALFINEHGNSSCPWAKKRVTHKKGWIVNLVCGKEYTLIFKNAEQMTNFSYTGTYYRLPKDCNIVMKHAVYVEPDRVAISSSELPAKSQSSASNFSAVNNDHGDWKYDAVDKQVVYLVSGKGSQKNETNRNCNSFKCYRCFFEDCKVPADPNSVAPRNDRPRDGVLFWSKDDDWKSLGAKTPVEGDCVVIPKDKWMVADVGVLPYFKCIKVFGTLEFEDKEQNKPGAICRNFHVKTRCMLIIGGRVIIGWENKPFCGTFKLELIGNHTSLKNEPCTDAQLKNNPNIGTKALCVFGGLDLHGKCDAKTWTRLDATANDGTNTITLAEAVNWQKDDEIVITATSYMPEESEVFAIAAIAANKKQITLNGTLKHTHIAHKETVNGKEIIMAAEVGLLTRNVKIQGDLDMGNDAFGARTLIGVASGVRGWGRVSCTEFKYSGQEGYYDSYDPRHSLSYLDTADADDIKPSYIRYSSFHHGYAPAIGMYGANNITAEWNVVHTTVSFAIETTSSYSSINHNMFSNNLWDGDFQGRGESSNLNYRPTVKAHKAKKLTLKGNRVSGSQRIAFGVVGQECDETENLYEDNGAHSSLIGLGILPKNKLGGSTICQKFTGFSCWRNYDFGTYLNHVPSFIIRGGFYAENKISIFSMVVGPGAVGHQYADKFVDISDTTIVGRTSSFSCSKDVRGTTTNIRFSSQGRTFNNGNGKLIGAVFPSFSSGGNSAPEKPFVNIMSYPAIKGRVHLRGVDFAHFKASPCDNGVYDTAIATNKNNDDGMHPMELSNITLSDVNKNGKVYFHPTNVGKVNPSDCVDMDCDGLKKALIKDKDGSFLGSTGAVIPKAEEHYNKDPPHGLGDYRIPKQMLTRIDGSRIPYNQLYDNTGILRNAQANFVPAWNAYEVYKMDYYMLIVESMDLDTELRRLSPIAFLCNGYMDLINGPQDHGWCFGYTCQKRLSTFMILVAADAECVMYFTGTNPTDLRFFLLNSPPDVKISLSIHYTQPNRKDVYNPNLVLPKNAKIVNGNYEYLPTDRVNQYQVNISSDSNGANYFDLDTQRLTFILQGPNALRLIQSFTIVLSFDFPPMSLTEVYSSDKIVNNLASYLNIPSEKIRIVDIRRETSSRRKRATQQNNDKLVVEIGSAPDANNTNTTTESDKEELKQVSTNLTNTVLSGKVHEALNVSEEDVKNVLIAETPDNNAGTEGFVKLSTAKELKFIIKPQQQTEDEFFDPQPSIRMFDTKDEPLSKVGSNSNPWTVTASVLSSTNPNAELQGNLSTTFQNGWANFTDLKFSQYGEFVIQFNISYPSEGENFTLNTEKLIVAKKQVDVSIIGIPEKIAVGAGMKLSIPLIYKVSKQAVGNIAWRKLDWKVIVSVYQGSQSNGTMSGTKQVTFDKSTGNATFNSLSFSAPGSYIIRFTVTTTPSDYNFYIDKRVRVLSAKQAALVIQERKSVKMKMKGDYDQLVAKNKEKFIAWIIDILIVQYGDILPENVDVKKGSIIVTFTIGGSTSDVNSTLYNMCSDAENAKSYDYDGTTLSFTEYLDVGGSTFYGVSCGPPLVTEKKEEKDSLKLIMIIVGCGFGLLIILALAFFILWKCTVHPKVKTKDINSYHSSKYTAKSLQDIESILFREKTFNSLGGRESSTPRPPMATNMLGPSVNRVHSPHTSSPVYNELAYPPSINSSVYDGKGHSPSSGSPFHDDTGHRPSSRSPLYDEKSSRPSSKSPVYNERGHRPSSRTSVENNRPGSGYRNTTVSTIGEPAADYPM